MKSYSIYNLQKRMFYIMVGVFTCFVLLFARLFYVQVIMGRAYSLKAVDQWTRDLPLTAKRGDIVDINGATLATSQTTYSIYVRPNAVKDAGKVAQTLSLLDKVSYDKAYQLATTKGISEALVAMQVSREDMLRIKLADLDGVYFSQTISRVYPYGDLLSQVLGYLSVDSVGQSGLELFYDKYLKGIDGSALVETDLIGREIENSSTYYYPSITGATLHTSLDLQIQNALEQTLYQAYTEQKAQRVTGIVMNPNTGEILALSSKPSFDLNSPPRNDMQTLMDLSKNRTIVDVYEPGSTFKILTMASALESGVTTLSDTFYDPGYRIIDGQRIKCWKTTGHGYETLTDALVNSCNSVFMDLALRMGVETFYSYLEKFGVNSKTGVDFSGESAGILMPRATVQNFDLARIGFGHSVAVTMLGLLTAVCSVVNGGHTISPSFVNSVSTVDGQTIMLKNPNASTQVISSQTSKIINNMLYEVVNKKELNSFVPGYNIGGKTGTAQKYQNGAIAQGKYVSSFIGTYPSDKPEYIIMIAVDEPSAGVYYGSLVAAPYGKMFFEKLFAIKNINPVNLEEDLKKVEKNITIPNCIGLSIVEACSLIASLGLNYEVDGEGNIVQLQIKAGGEKTFKNDTVYLITN